MKLHLSYYCLTVANGWSLPRFPRRHHLVLCLLLRHPPRADLPIERTELPTLRTA